MTKANTGYIKSSGFKLSYSIEGKGMPLLIPGCVLYDQRTFSKELRDNLRLIFLDHRGFVPPPYEIVSNTAFELDVLLSDIEMARKEIGLEKFFILGHSGHGYLALEYAKKYPQYINGVIMVAAAPGNSIARRDFSRQAFEKNASAERKKLFEKNMAQLNRKLIADPGKKFMHFLLATAPQNWYDPEFDASHLWDGIYTNMQAIDHIWGVVFRDLDITKGLDRFDKPVLLMLGEYDYLTGPAEVWDGIKEKFQNLTMKLFDKSAHCPQYEEPERFNRELLHWITTLS